MTARVTVGITVVILTSTLLAKAVLWILQCLMLCISYAVIGVFCENRRFSNCPLIQACYTCVLSSFSRAYS